MRTSSFFEFVTWLHFSDSVGVLPKPVRTEPDGPG
jgi:hypothetical protein